MTITVDELKLRFGTQFFVAVNSDCVFIPKNNFREEWRSCLTVQGCEVFNRVIPGKGNMVLVKLPQKRTIKKDVPVKKGRWSVADADRLRKRMAELSGSVESRIKTLREEFPDRTPAALLLKYKKMHRKEGPEPPSQEPETPIVAIDHDASPPQIQTRTEELLKEINDQLKLLLEEKLIHFECYCSTCEDTRTVEDSAVWKNCPVCGGPLIVWNVEQRPPL